MDQGHVGLYEELAASEPATLGKPGLGPFGPSDGDPRVTLRLAERSPAFGDRGENSADRTLRRAAGIERNKRRIGVLAKPIALPNCPPAFSRFRDLKCLHNWCAGAALSRSRILRRDYAVLQTTAEYNVNAAGNGFQDSMGRF